MPGRTQAPDRSSATWFVRGGVVVTPAGSVQADVVVRSGVIAELRAPTGAGALSGKPTTIDATGCWVLPGGVDPHCHVMAGIDQATRAAALGGSTTLLSFTNPDPGEEGLECFQRRVREVGRHAPRVDVGLHAMLNVPDRVVPAELAALVAAGVSGVKVFLAYPELGIMWSTRGLLELLETAAPMGIRVQVHCEEGEVIEGLVEDAIRDRRTSPASFAETRPPGAEASAVERVAELLALTGALGYVTHVSAARTVEVLRGALRRNWASPWGAAPLIAEACLHHLLLDASRHRGADGERFLVAPPLRELDDVAALRAALREGTITTVGSDHAQEPARTPPGLSADGKGYRYGLAGVGPRFPLLLSEGPRWGLSPERIVALACANPARAFGHFPRKGALLPGSDADVVVWDPSASGPLTTETFPDGTGDSVYDGRRLSGRFRDVLVRGHEVVRDGELVDRGARGVFLPARREGTAPRGVAGRAGVAGTPPPS